MAHLIDTKGWLDRIQTLMDVQKFECIEMINARFTRSDLIELRSIISTLDELENIKMWTDEPGDTIKCGNARERLEIRNELEEDGYELNFMPDMTIQIMGKKEGKQ